MRQICNLIPEHAVAKIARETGVEDKSRTFSPWSHVVSLLEQRLALVAKAVPATDETALIESFGLRVRLICRQLQLVQQTLRSYEQQIAAA